VGGFGRVKGFGGQPDTSTSMNRPNSKTGNRYKSSPIDVANGIIGSSKIGQFPVENRSNWRGGG